MISYILALLTGVLVLAADQLTKYFIVSNFRLYEGTGFIKGLIDIVYIHNTGGAWGVLQGKTWWLLIMTALIMVFCIVVLFKSRTKSRLMFWAMTLIVSGGIGNLIDRIFRDGNVVDFLQFAFWKDFPIFNVADCAIVVGVGMLIFYFVLDTVKEVKLKSSTENAMEKASENEEDRTDL